jgi:hypothetical protein
MEILPLGHGQQRESTPCSYEKKDVTEHKDRDRSLFLPLSNLSIGVPLGERIHRWSCTSFRTDRIAANSDLTTSELATGVPARYLPASHFRSFRGRLQVCRPWHGRDEGHRR